MALSYEKLMAHNPTSYGTMVNSIGQVIEFYEHPTHGDMAEVICVSHELKLADYSTFMETYDMMEEHGDYEPSFRNDDFTSGGNILHIGDFQAHD